MNMVNSVDGDCMLRVCYVIAYCRADLWSFTLNMLVRGFYPLSIEVRGTSQKIPWWTMIMGNRLLQVSSLPTRGNSMIS